MADDRNQPVVVRTLADDTLLVFLSDCHIGGDNGRDIFESPDDLQMLFDDIARHPGPVELVLAGDFFDCLRIANVPAGENRASITIARPEYADLFASLRRLASRENVRVLYLPGNHDAEVWWNAELRRTLTDGNLVHEFALSYAAAFASDPKGIIYSEHGNEFDAANLKRDYRDPYDTPLGDHIVTDIIPRLPSGRLGSALQLGQINNVFPLDTIPQWVAGRLFYTLVTQTVRLVIVPLMLAYLAFEAMTYFIGFGRRAINWLFIEAIYYITFLLLAFAVFFFVARRMTNRAIRSAPHRANEAEVIRNRIVAGEPMPLGGDMTRRLAVFVSGHTHDPALATADTTDGRRIVIVNSGCWLRQLQSVRAHFRAPEVFANRFVQTHVRIRRQDGATVVQLWEHPRPVAQRLLLMERFAIAGRVPPTPDTRTPRIRASATLS